jgi:hypothetical protein
MARTARGKYEQYEYVERSRARGDPVPFALASIDWVMRGPTIWGRASARSLDGIRLRPLTVRRCASAISR